MRLEAIHHALAPAIVPALLRIVLQLGGLRRRGVFLGRRDPAVRKVDVLSAAIEDDFGTNVVPSAVERFLPGGDDPPRDLVQLCFHVSIGIKSDAWKAGVMARQLVTEDMWKRVDPNGAGRLWITEQHWRESFSYSERVFRGKICRPSLAVAV